MIGATIDTGQIWASAISALGAVVAVILSQIRNRHKVEQKVEEVKHAAVDIAISVDGHLSDLNNRVTKLLAQLAEAGVLHGVDTARVAQLTTALEGSDTDVPATPEGIK